jgi:DNA (cytosine-5)-methyltransferase 1
VPVLLDLFCGGGGAAAGYAAAGFDVIGVDLDAQPDYPFPFVRADALRLPVDLGAVDAIHASPPCQRYSTATGRSRRQAHDLDDWPDLVAPTRELLDATGLPWILENVEAAPLRNYVRLCGSSFGLDLRRHRLFELGGWPGPVLVPPCAHGWQTPRFRTLDGRRRKDGYLASVVGVHGHANYAGERALREAAMGIDWLPPRQLAQAIPPAYTAWLGGELLDHLQAR